MGYIRFSLGLYSWVILGLYIGAILGLYWVILWLF